MGGLNTCKSLFQHTAARRRLGAKLAKITTSQLRVGKGLTVLLLIKPLHASACHYMPQRQNKR